MDSDQYCSLVNVPYWLSTTLLLARFCFSSVAMGRGTAAHLLLSCPKLRAKRQHYFCNSSDITDVFWDCKYLLEFFISLGILLLSLLENAYAGRVRCNNNKNNKTLWLDENYDQYCMRNVIVIIITTTIRWSVFIFVMYRFFWSILVAEFVVISRFVAVVLLVYWHFIWKVLYCHSVGVGQPMCCFQVFSCQAFAPAAAWSVAMSRFTFFCIIITAWYFVRNLIFCTDAGLQTLESESMQCNVKHRYYAVVQHANEIDIALTLYLPHWFSTKHF